MLGPGDRLPRFRLQTDEGKEINTGAPSGGRSVYYLYPKDDTSGCTAEACSFRDNLPDFESLGVPVYGVSPDKVESHVKFKTKHGLNFTLLADPDHAFVDAMGAWVEKAMYGRKYMGVQRSTFVVGPDGRIEHVWEKVTPAGHAAEVLAWLQSAAPASKPATKPAASKTAHPPRKAQGKTPR